MKLRFLGQAYSAANNRLETIPSERTARFLGQSYTLRQPVKPSHEPQLGLRKYRGVVYGA